MLCNHSELINRAIDAYFFFYSGSSRSTFSKRQPWQLQLCRIECHSVCLRQYKVAEKSNVASSGYSESFQPLSKSKKTNSCTDRSYSNFSSVFFFSFSFFSLWSALSCFKWHGEQEMCVCVCVFQRLYEFARPFVLLSSACALPASPAPAPAHI